jgi:hypothetical protein
MRYLTTECGAQPAEKKITRFDLEKGKSFSRQLVQECTLGLLNAGEMLRVAW